MKSLDYLDDIKRLAMVNNNRLAELLEYVRYILTDNGADTSVLEELIEMIEDGEV